MKRLRFSLGVMKSGKTRGIVPDRMVETSQSTVHVVKFPGRKLGTFEEQQSSQFFNLGGA